MHHPILDVLPACSIWMDTARRATGKSYLFTGLTTASNYTEAKAMRS